MNKLLSTIAFIIICWAITIAQQRDVPEHRSWSSLIGTYSTDSKYCGDESKKILILKEKHHYKDCGHFEIYRKDSHAMLMGFWKYSNDSLILYPKINILYDGNKFIVDSTSVMDEMQYFYEGDTIRSIPNSDIEYLDTFVRFGKDNGFIIRPAQPAPLPCPVDSIIIVKLSN